MELFAAAGLDLPAQSKSQPRAKRASLPSFRTPLFAYKAVEEALRKSGFAPDAALVQAAKDYARKIKGLKRQKETSFRPIFVDEVMVRILGYTRLDPDTPYTLVYEQQLGTGRVDTALGHFDAGGTAKIAAPFELKGPDTRDLDYIMPGRGKTPVQQAWEYANDAPGAKWVLVSNCAEIRLYGYGRGRAAYEIFDLTRLDQPDELRRLWEILGAKNFLEGKTDALLLATDSAYADITDALYESYKGLRGQLIDYLTNTAEGPKLLLGKAIEPAQKILDRILFIAFAQQNDLMRGDLMQRALKANNEFEPTPLWRNFIGLFRKVDKGDFDLDIPPYNGGLFARDELVDTLVLPDHLAKDIAALGQWDYKREVPVAVLGHIFEKSITDIDRMRAEARGDEAPKVTKVKRQGVVYTKSDAVIRFIVEHTLGRTLAEKRAALRAAHGLSEGDIAPEKEAAFWQAWLATLRGLTIVDPACGSGAFLVAAFDRLALEYRPVLARLEELKAPVDLDIFDEIVTKNLYGVDINAESVEITRLSLWLKTARRGHRLQSLDATIITGDSIVSDKSVSERAFDWHAAFPQVFTQGGFDVVIGNPPYVRMELIKPIKPWLKENYVVYDGSVDLYAYFFERGLSLLKPGGRLGYISSSTFFRTGSGENLRKYLTDGVQVERVVDFGDLQIFDGVTTYPAILTLKKEGDGKSGDVEFLKLNEGVPEELSLLFSTTALPMPRVRLGPGSWQFDDAPLARLRDKIVKGRQTLADVYGPPLYGIKTGLNEAFIVNAETRDRLVAADEKSADLLKPFLRGEDIARWEIGPKGQWIIFTNVGIEIADYPAIKAHLSAYKSRLEPKPKDWAGETDWGGRKAGSYKWYELQDTVAYWAKFAGRKIIFPDIADHTKFAFSTSDVYLDCTLFMIPNADISLLALLNSQISWFFWNSLTPILRGGFVRLKRQYVTQFPIPEMPKRARTRLAALAETCTAAARERFAIQSAVRHRMLDLAAPERRKLTRKLEAFDTLDFAAFRAEVKKAFRAEIPLKERGEWEAYLAQNAAEVRRLSAMIARAERDIDATVYALFELTPDEIALLESSLAGQY